MIAGPMRFAMTAQIVETAEMELPRGSVHPAVLPDLGPDGYWCQTPTPPALPAAL